MTDARAHLLTVAITIAQRDGWSRITRDGVAAEACVSQGSVNHQWGTIEALRSAVMNHAVEHALLPIVIQGIAAGHPVAVEAPGDLKRRALASM